MVFCSTTEEFLLSVGNVLNRQQLRVCLKDVRSLHREFCELPLNIPDKVTVPGSWAKNRWACLFVTWSWTMYLIYNSYLFFHSILSTLNKCINIFGCFITLSILFGRFCNQLVLLLVTYVLYFFNFRWLWF